MPPTRKDLLPICNDQGTPLEQFKMMFCDRCMQEECTRSRTGESKFERRVKVWHEELFLNPKRMDPNDPRFSTLSAQKFLTIDLGPVPEVRTSRWVDPRDLEEQAAPVVAAPPVVEPKPSPAPVPELVQPLAPRPVTKLPVSAAGMNTTAQKGQMIGGGPVIPPVSKDPWGAPAPPQPGDVVVKPGTKVTIGGSGSSGV